jgi:chromate transporter
MEEDRRGESLPPSSIFHPPSSSCVRVFEVARLFLRLGFTAFGGPAAHVALMEDEVVRRRGWVDREQFLDLVSAVNFVPGPNSTELAIHIGWIRAGFPGLVVAGVCFILPAMLIVLGLAWVYVAYGRMPQVAAALVGVKAAMVAIVAVALVRFARTGIKDVVTGALAVLAAVAGFVLPRWGVPQSELFILGAGAVVGILRYGRMGVDRGADVTRLANGAAKRVSGFAPIMVMPFAGGAFWGKMLWMTLFFLKVGATLFGSGYVLANYLYAGLVQRRGWLSGQELIDAIAVGQVTPGPLLTSATFIGYVLGAQKFGGGVGGGVIGGVLATVAIFLPAFVIVAALGPLLPRIRRNRWARGALDGMNAAVVALILVVGVWLARDTVWAGGRVQWMSAGVFAASLAVLLWTKVNATWVILAAGAVGVAAHLVK